MAVYEIPMKPLPQIIEVAFPSGAYQIRTQFCDADEGGWVLDISDVNGTPLVWGIPLVTGANLLAQYDYLGLGVTMFCTTDGDFAAPPSKTNLGVHSRLWLEY